MKRRSHYISITEPIIKRSLQYSQNLVKFNTLSNQIDPLITNVEISPYKNL